MTQWSCEKANDWYAAQPFLIGCNFLPSSASNQLEMFQAESFDEATLHREIGWAADLGFNSLRIYLHDLLIEEKGFFLRVDKVLDICAAHGISPILVFLMIVTMVIPSAGRKNCQLKVFIIRDGSKALGIISRGKFMRAPVGQNWRVWKIT